MSEAVAIVMAAGKGSRMKSELPKVLFPVLGRPMIEYVLDALQAGGVQRVLVVVGYREELVRETLKDRPGVQFVTQAEQLGTGHAVMVCQAALQDHRGPVLVVAGDSPMLRGESVQKLLQEFSTRQPACLLGTACKENPFGLGRIVRDGQGKFQGIVEERDADEQQKLIREVNLSVYVFDCLGLFAALPQVERKNAQGEYYLTDCPALMLQSHQTVEALPILSAAETLSINNLDELAIVERALNHERN